MKDWKKIADLGNKISKELKAEDREDSLKRWMAHRIAELLLSELKETDPIKKEKTRKECAELITRVWKIRKRFDPEDPISQINLNLHQLRFNDRQLINTNRIEEIEQSVSDFQAEPNNLSFLQRCDLRFGLAMMEGELLRASILWHLPDCPPDEAEIDQNDKIDPALYKSLIEARLSLMKSTKSADLSAILDAKDERSLKEAVRIALERIEKIRSML